jgi:hypothetical protein
MQVENRTGQVKVFLTFEKVLLEMKKLRFN